jgi:hypothetical protein
MINKNKRRVLLAALACINRSWQPIPIPRGKKAPHRKGWPTLRLRKSELCCKEGSARWLLEGLSRKGYIRRLPVPGRHFCYPILVNKYLVTNGEHDGERLSAIASESCALGAHR